MQPFPVLHSRRDGPRLEASHWPPGEMETPVARLRDVQPESIFAAKQSTCFATWVSPRPDAKGRWSPFPRRSPSPIRTSLDVPTFRASSPPQVLMPLQVSMRTINLRKLWITLIFPGTGSSRSSKRSMRSASALNRQLISRRARCMPRHACVPCPNPT